MDGERKILRSTYPLGLSIPGLLSAQWPSAPARAHEMMRALIAAQARLVSVIRDNDRRMYDRRPVKRMSRAAMRAACLARAYYGIGNKILESSSR